MRDPCQLSPGSCGLRESRSACLEPYGALRYTGQLTAVSFDVFVSYFGADEGIANSVKAALSRHRINAWLYKERNKLGDMWPIQIKKAIRSCDTLLVLLSQNSRESDWVRRELDIAWQYNRGIATLLLGPEATLGGSVFELLQSERFAKYHRTTRIATKADPDDGDLNSVLKSLASSIREHLRKIPHNLETRSREFVWREAELQTILAQEMPLLISGMSGVGKTELANEFAHKYMNRFKGGIFVAHWAEEDFAETLKRFAQETLDMTIPPHRREENKVQYIWDHWGRVGDVLVIVNDPNEGELKAVLPPRSPAFKVIVCSQMEQLLDMKVLGLGCLTNRESLDLLANHLGRKRVDDEKSAAQDIVKWAGGLPLAIDAVGRFLHRDTGESLTRYRDNLNLHGIDHDAFQRDPGKTREKTLRIAFDMQYGRLTDAGKSLAWTLGQLAYSPVFKQMLQAMHNEAAWQDLLHWNFLESTELLLYKVCHGLLHEYLRNAPNERAAIVRADLMVVSKEWADKIGKDTNPTRTNIHLRVHLEHLAVGDRDWVPVKHRIAIIDSVSLSYETQGLHRNVEVVCKRALKLLQQPDFEESCDLRRTFNIRIAGAQKGQGLYYAARSRLIGLLKESGSTPVRSQTFKIMTALGDVYRLTGQHEQSAVTYSRALKMAPKADRGHAIYHLARIERLLGNHRKAFELYRKAASKIAPESHQYAFALFGIGEAARLMRDFPVAEEKYNQSLKLFRKLLHQEGEAYALWGTGEVNRWLGRTKLALADHRRSEAICLEVGDRRSQAWAIMGIAEVFRATGRTEQAQSEFDRALHVLTDGRRHVDREPTEVSLALLGIAASKRLAGKATVADYQYSLHDYRRRKMSYYEVQCLIELALASRTNPRSFSRYLNEAADICRAKKYLVELDEIAAIRLKPNAEWVHQLNPA
jgi:tetratricopeptide (TPR) repeat protein